MKSYRMYNPPAIIENLGDGTAYYNFNIKKSIMQDEEGREYPSYNYDQVRFSLPVKKRKIAAALAKEGYEHTVKI